MDQPFKAAVFKALQRMDVESLGIVKTEQTWLHLRAEAATKLAASEELACYLKGCKTVADCGGDLLYAGEALALPVTMWGLRLFVPNQRGPVPTVTSGTMIYRVVPDAYLFWMPQFDAKEAWYAAVEIDFDTLAPAKQEATPEPEKKIKFREFL